MDKWFAIETLLHEVTINVEAFRKAKILFREKLAPDFNIFDVIRLDEMGLSLCIGTLLDAKGKHGQGDLFLREFITHFIPAWPRDLVMKYVRFESMAETRRIDILIQFEGGEILAIENKPWAGDQENQLGDYANFIEKQAKGKHWHLVYLCNNEPSERSLTLKHKEYLTALGCYSAVTFHELVDWLEHSASLVKASSVRMFVEDLSRMVRNEVNGELDMSEQKEINELILRSSVHLQSAFHIQKAMRTIKEELLTKFKCDLEEKISALGFSLVWDSAMSKSWKSYAGFGVKFKPNHDIHMRFEFDSPNLQNLAWGLRRDHVSVQKVDEQWTSLNLNITKKFGAGRASAWWPWYKPIEHTTDWSSEDENWDTNFEPWMKIQSGEMANTVIKMTIEVWEALEPIKEMLVISPVLSSLPPKIEA